MTSTPSKVGWMRNLIAALPGRTSSGVRQHWRGKLVIKGIPSMAKMRCARATLVPMPSCFNHGGRQLDGVPSTISQLPKVAQALTGSVPILLDGGLRNGIDVLRALALGAQGVLISRPWDFCLGRADQAGGKIHLAQPNKS